MAEETERTGLNGDTSLDDDTHDDPQKGAAIGGIGGAVAGAVAGSMAGPVGTIAGAVIGGIVGAITSRAAVGAIDKIEHENAPLEKEAALPVASISSETTPETIRDSATDREVVLSATPYGAPTPFAATEDTPYAEDKTEKAP